MEPEKKVNSKIVTLLSILPILSVIYFFLNEYTEEVSSRGGICPEGSSCYILSITLFPLAAVSLIALVIYLVMRAKAFGKISGLIVGVLLISLVLWYLGIIG